MGKILHRYRIAIRVRAALGGSLLGAVLVLGGLAATTAPAAAQNAAQAQDPSRDRGVVYTVRDVPVRAEGATVVEAKDQALARGQQDALRILLQRLTLSEDHGRLPQPEPAEVEPLVLGLSINDERTPPRGYIATLTVSFVPEAVQALLENADIPFTDQRGPRLVIVPVWQGGTDAAPLLWDDPNPWRTAWAERRRQGLVPLETPLGDLEDVISLDVDQVLVGDDAALADFAERYGAAGALTAIARLDQAPDGGGQVRIDAAQTGTDVEQVAFTSIQPLPAGVPVAESLPQALSQGVRAVIRQIDEVWKMRAVGFSGATSQLTALVPLDGRLDDWLDVRRRLEAAMAVQDTTLQALNRTRAQVTLRFSGTEGQLAQSLSHQGLILRDEGGYWSVERSAPADGPALAPPSDPPALAPPATSSGAMQ